MRITVCCSAIVIESLFTVIPQGPFESNGRKQLSLSSCGWVLIRSGQFKITCLVCVSPHLKEEILLVKRHLEISFVDGINKTNMAVARLGLLPGREGERDRETEG